MLVANYKAYLIDMSTLANQKELVADLIRKAKEIEYLVESLPVPEPEGMQVCSQRKGFPKKIPHTRRFNA